MTTKLTLSVDRKVVVRAKRYAARRKTSVSRLVEEYLDLVSRSRSEAEEEDPPVLRLMRGVARGVDPEDYGRYLVRKYL
jgi:hypothetical protein